MKKLELAYEIIKESKKSRALYLESGRDYHKVAAHMYSIFECYAHGIISWNSVRSYWHNSNLEYLNLYKDNETLYVMESNRMLAEYENTLKRFKPALDEYKKVSEAKMVSNIVIKNQISESVAKEQSNLYYNKRNLSESAVKEIAHIADWKQVVESYPNLTANDKDRVRMLTIFENDTFNVTGWSQLNEGPTLDTTQMITTVMSEAPTPTMDPAVIRKSTAASANSTPNLRPGMVGSMVGGQIGRMAGSAIAGPVGGMIGGSIGSQIGTRVGTNMANRKSNASAPSAAPATSLRPMPRPMVATEDGMTSSLRPKPRPAMQSIGAGSQVSVMPNGAVDGSTRGIDPADAYSPDDLARLTGGKPSSGAPATSIRPMPRPSNLGGGLMKDVFPPRGDMEMDPSNMREPSNLAPKRSLRPQPRPQSNVGRSEMSPTPGVWDGSTRGFESIQKEGYKTVKSIDKERYDEIPGLEGPFMTLSGKVVYYDPKEGSYYDRDTDMYLSYDEFKELDNDYSGMKNNRPMKEAKTKPGHNAKAMARAQEIIRKSIEKSQEKSEKEKTNEASYRDSDAQNMMKASRKADKEADKERERQAKLADKKKDKVDEAVAKIACTKCDEVSTAKAWEKNNGFCPKCKTSNQGVAESASFKLKATNLDEGKNLTDTKADWRSDKSATAKNWSHNKLMKVAKHDRSAEKEIKRRIASKEYVFANEEVELSEANTSYEKDMDHDKPVVVSGVKGMKSTPFRKKFKNMAAYDKWSDSEEAGNYEVHNVMNEDISQPVVNKSSVNEGDIVDFGSFAGMYSDGARVSFMDKQGQMHTITATGGVPREYTLDGNPISREKLLQLTRGIKLGRFQQGVDESVNEGKATLGAAVNRAEQKRQVAIRKAKAWMKRTGKSAADAAREFDLLKGDISKLEESTFNEAVTLDYSRHMRSHGSKPRDPGYSALWMFTTREYGMPDDDEIFKFQGSFADAKKAAAKWAKSQDAYRVYVME
jgi:hypothetical protein